MAGCIIFIFVFLYVISDDELVSIKSAEDEHLQSNNKHRPETFTVTHSLLARRVGTVALATVVLMAGILCKAVITLPQDTNDSLSNNTLIMQQTELVTNGIT